MGKRVIMGNPIMMKDSPDTYMIIYYNEDTDIIEKHEHLTKYEALELPYVPRVLLEFL